MRSTEQAERIEFTLAFLDSEWGKTPEVERQEFVNVVYSWVAMRQHLLSGGSIVGLRAASSEQFARLAVAEMLAPETGSSG